MPTYVYECKECEKVFEVDQRITEDPLQDCECGAKGALRRLIQPTAVMFKGSGFHINDYAASKGNEGSSAGTPAPSDASAADAPVTPGPTNAEPGAASASPASESASTGSTPSGPPASKE